MSLPIVLFESAPSPLAAGRQRLDGNGGRMFVAGALAFAPLSAVEIGIYLLRSAIGSFDNDPALFWLVDVVLINILQIATSFATILVMKKCRAFGKAIWDITGKGNDVDFVFEHPGEQTFPVSCFVVKRGGMEPILMPTLVGTVPGCKAISLRTASRIDSAMDNSCILPQQMRGS